MKKTCPLNGESECDGCKFYTKDFTTEYMCDIKALLVHANEMTQNIKILTESSEQHRETHVQFIKSGLQNGPTKELLRLAGVSDATN